MAEGGPNPVPTIVMLAIVLSILVVPWLVLPGGEAEDDAEDSEEAEGGGPLLSMSPLLVLLPLVLLLAVRFLSTQDEGGIIEQMQGADASTIHRFGITVLLFIVIALVSFPSLFLGQGDDD